VAVLRDIPTLDAIARNPELIRELGRDALETLAIRAATVDAALRLQLSITTSKATLPYPAAVNGRTKAAPQPAVKTVSLEAACALLQKPRKWLIRNRRKFAFVIRLTRKHLVVDEAGLHAYLATLAPGGHPDQR
jgi:hypothetical protein